MADELASGVPAAGASGLATDLDLGRGLFLFAALLSVPMAIGLLLEPLIHAWSDRVDRRPLLLGALAGASLSLALASVSVGPLTLVGALGAWSLCTGVACGVAQAGLVASASNPSRAMTRWALATSVGDLAAPLVVGTLAAVGLGWRAALAVAAGGCLFVLVATARAPLSEATPDGDDHTSTIEALWGALRTPRLLAWLAAIASCTLLDEIVLMLAALRAGGEPWATSLQLGALVVGDGVGLLAAEQALRRWSPRRVLIFSAAATAAGLGGWLVAPTVATGAAALFVVGASAALHWPLAKAAAFASLPGRPGLVNALDTLASAFDLVAPLGVGLIASRFGVDAAIAALVLQPLCVGGVAAIVGQRG